MKKYIKLIRLKHSIKNFLIFVPLLFSGQFFNAYNITKTFIGFLTFTLLASSIYIVNDIKDKEKDRQHPTKCKRPIASGEISVKKAILFFILILSICIISIIINNISIYSIILLILYFILNLGYSFGLKNVPLLDIVILVSGFIIRVLFGASLLDIELSNWLILTILTISFYLGLGKRRNEIEKNGSNSRNVLKYYNKNFLDKNMYMLLSSAIVFYSLWTVDKTFLEKNDNMLVWTVPFVIVLAMKYSMDIEGDSDGDPVEVIIKDKILLILGIIYAAILVCLIYL